MTACLFVIFSTTQLDRRFKKKAVELYHIHSLHKFLLLLLLLLTLVFILIRFIQTIPTLSNWSLKVMVPYDPVSKTLRTDRVIVLCVGMLAIASPLKPQEIEIWHFYPCIQYT